MEHEAQLLNWTAFLYAWAMESVGTIDDKLKLYFTVCDQVKWSSKVGEGCRSHSPHSTPPSSSRLPTCVRLPPPLPPREQANQGIVPRLALTDFVEQVVYSSMFPNSTSATATHVIERVFTEVR